jgi:hypothetical protein
MTPQERVQATIVWEFVLFILNGFVFVLVGLGLPAVMQALPHYDTPQLMKYGLIIVLGMISLRMAWVVPGTFLPWVLSRKQRATVTRPSVRHSILIGWTGMRGAVSLAGALALPLAFQHRGIIIFLTFFAIVMVASNHLRFLDSTPASRLWSLAAIALIVFGVLMWNVFLTRRARSRMLRLESFASRLRAGPEFKVRKVS